jgi:hypothetical protein
MVAGKLSRSSRVVSLKYYIFIALQCAMVEEEDESAWLI